MAVLILAEHDNSILKTVTLNTITAAQRLSTEVDLLIAGENCQELAVSCARLQGINHVLLADHPGYRDQIAEPLASLLVSLAPSYQHLLAPATYYGKNIMPRVAALLDVAQISDIVEIIDTNTFVRPIYAGNALAKVQSLDSKKVITVRSTAFPAVAEGGSAEIKTLDTVPTQDSPVLVERHLTPCVRPELTAARVIVSGGRGLGSKENFHQILDPLADTLSAAIGASRAAVDAGFTSNDCQVGQTGKVVAPRLYIAIGISGAIQHIAGMKDSGVIVAINKDSDAPIFQLADYGLVADLFAAVPELTHQLAQLQQANH
ncbi:MAG: electron transfer flavoprotein subunit alpha/FixB family protein [Enterobacteriaceae bacterium]